MFDSKRKRQNVYSKNNQADFSKNEYNKFEPEKRIS